MADAIVRKRKPRAPEYNTWINIKARCYGPAWVNGPYQKNGIQVCERWRASFAAFLEDMGPRPSRGHSIDRIDNNGDYAPGNCQWATRAQQNRNTSHNRKITWRGETKVLMDWAAVLRLRYVTLRTRLARGWTVEEAFTTPAGEYGETITWRGQTKTLTEWAEALNISFDTLRSRFWRGYPVDKAFTRPVQQRKCSQQGGLT